MKFPATAAATSNLFPMEILLMIFGWFNAATMGRAARACKLFHVCAQESSVWKSLCQRKLGRGAISFNNKDKTFKDWKSLYIKELHFFKFRAGSRYAVMYQRRCDYMYVSGQCPLKNTSDSKFTRVSLQKKGFKIQELVCSENTITCLDTKGGIWVWGKNKKGSLGVPKTQPRAFVEIFLPQVIVQIASSCQHNAFVSSAGDCYVWGSDECRVGCLGLGDSSKAVRIVSKPTLVETNAKFSSVSCGNHFTLAITQDCRDVYGWGLNDNGQLCTGDYENQWVPKRSLFSTKDDDITTIEQACVGLGFTLILSSGGLVYGCGKNAFGVLGKQLIIDSRNCFPHQLEAICDIQKIATGYFHCLALPRNGVGCIVWGNTSNFFDCKDSIYSPLVRVLQDEGGQTIVDIASGTHQCFLTLSNNGVRGLGLNFQGQMGFSSPKHALVRISSSKE